jgi:hypothetical protein
MLIKQFDDTLSPLLIAGSHRPMSQAQPSPFQQSSPAPSNSPVSPDVTTPAGNALPSLRQFLTDHLAQQQHDWLLETTQTVGASSSLSSPPTQSTPPEAHPVGPTLPDNNEADNNEENLTPFEQFARRGLWQPVQSGQYFNSLDTETPSGIEQLLPTPTFRFKIMRNRIQAEITDIQTQLANYQHLRLPPVGLAQKIAPLQERLRTLQQHDLELAFQQNVIRIRQPLWVETSQQTAKTLERGLVNLWQWLFKALCWVSPVAIARRNNPKQQEWVAVNQQLKTIISVLETELAPKKTQTIDDVGAVLRQYEQLVTLSTTLGQSISNKQGLMTRLNQHIQRLIRNTLLLWQGGAS